MKPNTLSPVYPALSKVASVRFVTVGVVIPFNTAFSRVTGSTLRHHATQNPRTRFWRVERRRQ